LSSRVAITAAGCVLFVAFVAAPVPTGLRVSPLDRYGSAVTSGEVPYRDFSLEYPPGALPPILIPALVPEVRYDRAFRVLEALIGAAVVAAVARLRRTAPIHEFVIGVVAVAAVPVLLGPVVYFRFDLWPTLLTLAAIGLIESRRGVSGGVGAGVAAAAKLFPIALALPLALEAKRHDSTRRAVAAGIIAFVAVVAPFAGIAPGGVASSFTVQLRRHLQIESIGGSLISLSSIFGIGNVSTVFESGGWDVRGPGATALQATLTAAGLAAVAWLWWRAWRAGGRQGIRTTSAAIVATVLVFTNVLSPQYLVWLVPLVALVPGGSGVMAIAALAAAEILTNVLYPSHYDALVGLHVTEVILLVVRNALLVATAAVLVSRVRPQSGS
jgi:Glycosyltransferase family 87